MRAAKICAILVNVNRDPKKSPRPAQVQDFMPKFEPPKQQSPEQMLAWAKAMFGPKEEQENL